MLPLTLGRDRAALRVLCLGAHCDDIEIGCAGTLLRWLAEFRSVEITWVVLSALDRRGEEARTSVRSLLRGTARIDIVLGEFKDSYLPAHFADAKSFLAEIRSRTSPDVVLTHRLDDRHQDHRVVSELTWQIWRDHLILEYEIPKYEGDIGQANILVPLTKAIARRKVRHLIKHFGSQRPKDWFNEDTFLSLMRIRGIECRAGSGFAEAFHARKAVI